MRKLATAFVAVLLVLVAVGGAEAKWVEKRRPTKPTAEILKRGELDCSSAIPISVGETVYSTNVGAPSNADGYPECIAWNESGGEVVYELTIDGPTCQDIGIALWYRVDLDLDLDWFLLDSCDENGQCVEFDDYSDIVDCLAPGTYYLIVDGYYGDESEYILCVYRNEPIAECSPLTSVCHEWNFNTSDEGFEHVQCGIPQYAWEWGPAPDGIPETACGGIQVNNVLCTGLEGEYVNNAGDAAVVGPVVLGEDCNCLELCHFYSLEDGVDQGMVGLTADVGVTWNLLTPARGYDDYGDWDNTCIGPYPAFQESGATEFRTDSFDLTPWIGETVFVGFFFGSNSSVSDLGWYILRAAIGTSGSPVESTSWGAIKAMYR